LYTADLNLNDNTEARFRVYIDGVYDYPGFAFYETESGSGQMRVAATIQHYITDLTPGTHDISIWAENALGTAWVVYSKLFIQSYNV